jgi:hypothetical protein
VRGIIAQLEVLVFQDFQAGLVLPVFLLLVLPVHVLVQKVLVHVPDVRL